MDHMGGRPDDMGLQPPRQSSARGTPAAWPPRARCRSLARRSRRSCRRAARGTSAWRTRAAWRGGGRTTSRLRQSRAGTPWRTRSTPRGRRCRVARTAYYEARPSADAARRRSARRRSSPGRAPSARRACRGAGGVQSGAQRERGRERERERERESGHHELECATCSIISAGCHPQRQLTQWGATPVIQIQLRAAGREREGAAGRSGGATLAQRA